MRVGESTRLTIGSIRINQIVGGPS